MKISFWDVLSILALLGVGLFVALFLVIFSNPYSPLNPLKPPVLPTLINLNTTRTPTITLTPFIFPPTWTMTAAIETSSVQTTPSGPRRTFTLIPTNTLFVLSSFTGSGTSTKTATITRTRTLTPTITKTPTITLVPTDTAQPTYTLLPTYTIPPTKTLTPAPSATVTSTP